MSFIKRILITSLAIFSFSFSAHAADFKPVPGKFYAELPQQAQRIVNDPDSIEVVEVFSYTCGHCARLEPIINKWAETKPEGVDYIKLAMTGERWWGLYAQVFYTLEVMGANEIGDPLIFDALHVKNNNSLVNKETIAKFLGNNGVDEAAFLKNWDSFAVKAKINRADEIVSKQYGVNFTPAIIVNGKYLISGELAGPKDPNKDSFDNLIDVLNDLIADIKSGKVK